MALTDILRGAYRTAQNVVRPAVLGLALAYCGPTVDDDRGCDTDADCHGDRICNYNTGRCESPGGGNGNNNNNGGTCTPIQYIWNLSECGPFPDFVLADPEDFAQGEICRENLVIKGRGRLARNFGKNDIDPTCMGNYESIRCAVDQNPNLYLRFDEEGPLCLKSDARILLFSDQPSPAREDCEEIIKGKYQCNTSNQAPGRQRCLRTIATQEWYQTCFPGGDGNFY